MAQETTSETQETSSEAQEIISEAEELTPEELKVQKQMNKAAKKEEKSQEKAAKKAAKKELPKMPKWMRFLVILFAINFVLTLANLCFTSRDLVNYTGANILDWMNLVFEMVLLWMIWCRFKIARYWVMIYTTFNVSFGLIETIVTQSDFLSWALISLWDVGLFMYFWRSKKTKAYLTEKFGIDRESAAGNSKELVIDRKSWAFYRNLGIYYCFFSLFGHWMECACSKLMELGIISGEVNYNNTLLWRDWFYPFPMEGLAVVLIALLLYPLWRYMLKKFRYPFMAYGLSFVANALVCCGIEFTMGMFVNADLQLWDYSSMPFNFMGQICLQNTLGFGGIASLIAWIVYPALERGFQKVPKNIMNLVFVVTVTAYMIPQTLYLIDPPKPYRVELQEILAMEELSDDSRAYYQSELDKLDALEAQGSILAGADDKAWKQSHSDSQS